LSACHTPRPRRKGRTVFRLPPEQDWCAFFLAAGPWEAALGGHEPDGPPQDKEELPIATNRTRPALDDEQLSDADRAAIDRTLAEPGITLSADELAALLATGGDDEVRDLLAQPARSAIAAGQVAEAIGVAKFVRRSKPSEGG